MTADTPEGAEPSLPARRLVELLQRLGEKGIEPGPSRQAGKCAVASTSATCVMNAGR